jgi:valyl-tRNA synthetase
MPFITEELYQHLNLGDDKKSIMFDNTINTFCTKEINANIIPDFETAKEIITNIRNIRASKNISPKEKLTLQVSSEHNSEYDDVIEKLANIEKIEIVTEKSVGAVSFMVGTCEYAVLVGNLINAEEEIAKMETEIKYLEGFLKSVQAKLSNEKFVSNAKPEVVENEYQKQADAEGKIKTLRENIKHLK